MYYLHHSATAFAAIVAGVIASTHAQAGSRVGGATSIVHDVASSVSGETWAKKVEGDDVYENEFIRTQTESSARISFIDETDIKMGPAARMKIDRVVFKSGRTVSELVVIAEAGAVRWNSGVSQSNAYLIKTPTVIIKVRGTTFDLFAEPQQTTVVLRRGTIEVCAIDNPQRCQTLSRPGDTVVGTPNVLERPRRAGHAPSDFADRCLSARATAPCAILASVQPTRTGSVEPTRPPPPRPTGGVPPGPIRVDDDRGRPGPPVVYDPPRPPKPDCYRNRRGCQASTPPPTSPKPDCYRNRRGGCQASNPPPTPPKPDCYRNRRGGCQASPPPKPGRPDAKPYPNQAQMVPRPSSSTQKPTYTTQTMKAYAQPRQTMPMRQTMQVRQTVQPRMMMRQVYRPPAPKYNIK